MNACIVLAGGSGRRMGGIDKATLQVARVTLLDRVLGAAMPLCASAVVVGPFRPTSMRNVVFTHEDPPGRGPVPAVLAGLSMIGSASFVFLLAADLPLLSSAGLEQLKAALVNAGARTGAAAADDGSGRANPLLAVYRLPALRDMTQRLLGAEANAPAAFLLPDVTLTVRLGPRETLNVNTPADLAAARKDADPGLP